ncbi:uncharacterized protein LOC110643496 [Hevea brasiliensis]|uniref:uncharacterized protein LOC110643496 n=1 Tax=Hevea brasiliensis TaxID=3981 RepID=UPI0025D6DD37|nr:uncharacterized protein LOC110643496 [Hevea brasiliensis]
MGRVALDSWDHGLPIPTSGAPFHGVFWRVSKRDKEERENDGSHFSASFPAIRLLDRKSETTDRLRTTKPSKWDWPHFNRTPFEKCNYRTIHIAWCDRIEDSSPAPRLHFRSDPAIWWRVSERDQYYSQS